MRNLQHKLAAIIDEVGKGETIEVTRHSEVVAQIIPVSEKRPPEPWPDMRQRLYLIYGDREVTPSASDVIYVDRA